MTVFLVNGMFPQNKFFILVLTVENTEDLQYLLDIEVINIAKIMTFPQYQENGFIKEKDNTKCDNAIGEKLLNHIKKNSNI